MIQDCIRSNFFRLAEEIGKKDPKSGAEAMLKMLANVPNIENYDKLSKSMAAWLKSYLSLSGVGAGSRMATEVCMRVWLVLKQPPTAKSRTQRNFSKRPMRCCIGAESNKNLANSPR